MVIIKTAKLFSILVLSVLLLSTACAYDLSDYPEMFIESGEFRGYFIVGDHANPLDVVSMIDIAVTMQAAGQERGGEQISVTASRLASEVKALDHNDAIIVGTPCNNEWIAKLKGSKSCESAYDIKMGDAVIEYIRKNSNNYVIVTGYTSHDVKKASSVLADYWEHPELNGYQVNIRAGRITVTKANHVDIPSDLKMKPASSVLKLNPKIVDKKASDKMKEDKVSSSIIAVPNSGSEEKQDSGNAIIVRKVVAPFVSSDEVEVRKAKPSRQKIFVINH